MIVVALIEDNRLVREGLASQFNSTADIRAFATSVSGADETIERNMPRVILLDASLGEQECIRLTDEFNRDFPEAKLVIMDLSPERHDILKFVNLGVSGFVGQEASFDDLLHTIRAVADGEKVLPQTMTTALFSQITRDDEHQERRRVLADVRLTPRENEIIQLIKDGNANREMAAALGISAHTVKSHVRNLMDKLAVRTRLQIAKYAHGEERKSNEA